MFIAGGDAEKEADDFKKNELETWTKKLVVASPTFKVNTIVSAHNNVDKYKTILEDSAQKVGLILSKKKVKNLTVRNVQASRALSPLPISQYAQEEWKMNEHAFKSSVGLLPDINKTPMKPSGNREESNFNRNLPRNQKSQVSRKI